jgi:dihydroxyacetone kinase
MTYYVLNDEEQAQVAQVAQVAQAALTQVEHRVALRAATHQARYARWELGGILLGLLRAGEPSVRFDDPRVAPALEACRNAEADLGALTT